MNNNLYMIISIDMETMMRKITIKHLSKEQKNEMLNKYDNIICIIPMIDVKNKIQEFDEMYHRVFVSREDVKRMNGM